MGYGPTISYRLHFDKEDLDWFIGFVICDFAKGFNCS